MPKGERPMVPDAKPTSYYGRPILKEPVWKWPIPAYFFTGGLAAGSALLGAGSRLRGDDAMAGREAIVALGAVALSSGFLVTDLGRPERFANMLRVAKPTSPMSMGTWILAGFGPAAGVAAVADALGILPRTGRAAQGISALLAPALATYTAVLVADTAVPAWHEARGELPFVFAGGAAASAGGLGVLLAGGRSRSPGARAARRMAIAGAAVEVGAHEVMRRRLGDLAEPYEQGRAGALHRAAEVLVATGAGLLTLLGGKRRAAAMVGGGSLMAGAAFERFAVFEAGRQSARDPKYVVAPQRAALNGSADSRRSGSAPTASGH
jgi:formate-dependent nitrite reductase membrane component NrfD